jgi:hypothetical protein
VIAARVVILSLLLVPAADALAQEVSLASVLERSAAYVANYRRQLSGIVAEEQYTQDERLAATASLGLSGTRPSATHRELKSDFLLVPAPGADGLVEFRDVFEVDGKPVRDRENRLARLFLQRSPTADDQIRTIVVESARYNIGGVYREMNTPTLPLLFLDARYQPRFTFKRSNDTAPQLSRGSMKSPRFAPLPGLWIVEYEETARNTLIQRVQIGGDMPARGRFWIEPDTGRVVISEVIVSDPVMRATIDVAYQNDPAVGMFIPVEMRERYENNRARTVTTGTATYSRIRRFDVQVKEDIAPVRD